MIDKILFEMHHGPPFVWYEEDASTPPNEQWGETERSYPKCDGCSAVDVPLLVINADYQEYNLVHFCEECVEKFLLLFD